MKPPIPSKLGNNSKISALLMAGVLALPALTAKADISWQGAADAYTNALAWVGGVVPGSGDNTINDNGSNNVVQITSDLPDWSIHDFRAANANGVSGAFLQDGPTVNAGGWVRLGIGTGAVGVYTLNSGVLNANEHRINVGELGTGILNVNGGTINFTTSGQQFALGDGPAGSLGVVYQASGSTINSIGECWIGNSSGVGYYNMSGGTLNVNNNWFVVGRHGNDGASQGYLTMTGGTITKSGGGHFLVGDAGTTVGLVEQSGGTINITGGELRIPGSGDGFTPVARYNMSGTATLIVNNWLAIGRSGGAGTLNLTNGSITKLGGGNLTIGSGGGAIGTLNQYGGAITNNTSSTYIGEGNGQGLWNFNGGIANLGVVDIIFGGTTSSTLNLNGGVMTLQELTTGNTGGVSQLTLNGGTLRASGNNASFFHDITFVNLSAGGVTFDSQSFNITVSQAMPNNGGDNSGGLTKNGSGTLTLTGANSYAGPTLVNAGKLAVSTSATGAGNYSVANDAELSVTVLAGNQQLNMANLSLATSTAATLDIDLGGFGNPAAAPLNVGNTLTVNGVITVNITDTLPQIGQFPLISFATPAIAGSFVLGPLPVGVGAYISNNVSSIDLVITNVNLPRWEGLAGGTWDLSGSTNWINIGNNTPTSYGNGNAVIFNNQAAGPTTVNLTATVTPLSVTFNNNSLLYTLVGTGKISGSTGITKQDTGTASILNTGGNNFTGPVVISGGVLAVTNLANGGSASALGAASSNPTNLVLNGGDLSYSGPAVSINRGYLTQQTNSSITTVSNLTLTGVANATLFGGLIKSGDAQLTYKTIGSNVLSGSSSPGFSVQAGTVLFDGSGGGQTNQANKISIDGLTADATLTLTNTTVNIGDLNLGGIASTTGTLNINSNSTLNLGGWLIFGDGGNSTGTINLNAGTLNVNTGDLLMGGRAGAVSTLNINGGVFNKAGGTINIAPGNWNVSGARTGTINQSAGIVNCSDELRVGQAALGEGYYNLSGGTLNQHNWLQVGNAGAFGQFTMTGGTINKDGNAIKIGNGGGVGVFNQSGGTIASSSEYWVAENNGTIGTNNISGTAVVNVSTYVTVGRAGLGVVNMSGGTFNDTAPISNANPFYIGIFAGGIGVWNHSGGALNINPVTHIGDGSTGDLNVSGGVVNILNDVWIGQGATGTGAVTMASSGVFTNTGWLAIGREDGKGVLNINGGTMVKTGGGNISIAHGIGDQTVVPSGTVNQNGGTFICASGETWIGEDSGPGIWNMSGGTATLGVVHLAQNASATGTLNLTGGVFAASEVTTISAGTSTLNFSGGTLSATGNNANFLHGLTAAYVNAGGAVINSGANVITVSQPLLDGGGGGGLTKDGTGSLTLTGTSTYTGTTLVNAGSLIIGTATLAAGGNAIVADNAGLSVLVQSAGAQYAAANVTLGSSTGASLTIDLGTFGNPGPAAAPLNVASTLTANGTTIINISDAIPQLGAATLIKYGARAGVGNFVLGSLPVGVTASIVTNISNSSIDLNITGVNQPRWEGLAGGNWDIALTTNWINIGTSLPTTFSDGSPAVFNDSALGTTSVNLAATVSPNSVTVTNNTLSYAITGTGKISGTTGLKKQGANTLALLNTGGNNFTGPVTLSGGTLSVTNLANGGLPSAIGAASANPTNLVLAGGTLSYSGPTVTVNRGYQLTGNSVLDVQGNVTLTGLAQATGGTLVKSGAGTQTYAGVGTNVITTANVGGAYQVKAGGIVFDGSAGVQTNTVIGEMWVASATNSAVNLVVTNTSLGISSWFALGRGNGNSNYLSTASVYNSILNISYGNVGTAGGGGGVSLGYNAGLPFNAASQVLNLYGTSVLTNAGGNFNIAESPGSSAVLNLTNSALILSPGSRNYIGGGASRGVVNLNSTATSVIAVNAGQIFLGGTGGTSDSGVGALNISAGTLRFGNGSGVYIHLSDNGGTVPTSYGSYVQSGGLVSLTSGDGIRVGFGGWGSFVQSGGTLLCGRYLSIGGNTVGGNGVATFTGGTAGIFNTGFRILLPDAAATGVFNLGTEAGGTAIFTNLYNSGGNSLIMVNTANGNGTLNLNSGTIQLGGAVHKANTGTAVANLNGGTLQAGANNITLLDTSLNSLNVFKGGLTIDTLGNTATASGNLLTTAGNGIYPAAGTLVISTNGGAGYIGAPLVTVSGGSGSGAMAIATVAGGVVTNVIMTCPGQNYVAGNVLTFAFNGGGATTVASNFVYTLQAGDLAANSGGGLTKNGNGTLYLTGTSTYTGTTLVSNGTLGGSGTLAGSVTVAAGATLTAGVGAIGTLSTSNALTFAAGSTNFMKITPSSNDQLAVLNGVTYNGALIVTNTGGALTIGHQYTLVNSTVAGSGNFTSVTILPTGTYAGTFNPTTGVLTIVTPTPPTVNPPKVSGGNLILTGSGGTPGAGYTWLTSTNLANPVAAWVTNLQSVFDGAGAFSNAVPIIATNPAQFFRLRTP